MLRAGRIGSRRRPDRIPAPAERYGQTQVDQAPLVRFRVPFSALRPVLRCAAWPSPARSRSGIGAPAQPALAVFRIGRGAMRSLAVAGRHRRLGMALGGRRSRRVIQQRYSFSGAAVPGSSPGAITRPGRTNIVRRRSWGSTLRSFAPIRESPDIRPTHPTCRFA